jgi:hypothetical protein
MALNKSRYMLASIVAIAAVSLPAAARAQSGSWHTPDPRVGYSDERQLPYYDSRRFAYDQGYREGIREGERDARRGDRFGYQDEREFRDGDRGYQRTYGDRERYRQSFRSGYAAGYSDSYRRLGNQGGSPRYGGNPVYGNSGYGYGYGYSTPALENGARDGYEKGLEDLRKNRTFDPLRHSWYRSGDRHYEREYGLKDDYKNAYRRGFQQGYERAFQGGRYR